MKPYLLTRNELDGRTGAAKAFDALVAAIENDLGGADQLTSIERSLVEGFVGATITLKNINAKMCLGHEIDVADLLIPYRAWSASPVVSASSVVRAM